MKSSFSVLLATFCLHFSPIVAEELQFKPAQSNLTEIYVEIAQRLETHGHPGPYLRHIKSEHQRIATKYQEQLGTEMPSHLPSYLTDQYIDALCRDWDELGPKLKLNELADTSGRLMRLAIKGESGKGTSLVALFNHHQDQVFNEMVSDEKKGRQPLKAELLKWVKNGEEEFLASREDSLSETDRKIFLSLIEKPKFSKEDFTLLDTFYDGSYDRLSEDGKSLLTARVQAGQSGTEVPPSDAEKYSKELTVEFEVLFKKLREQLSKETAEKLVKYVEGVVEDLVVMSSVELELGIREWTLK